MNRRYLDIDEILAEDERVTCKTLQEYARLGHLNSELNSVDLPRDSNVDLPLWLAQIFFEVWIFECLMTGIYCNDRICRHVNRKI